MAQSFVFLGVPSVGTALARNLLEAGYLAAGGMDSADIVITLCSRQNQVEDVYYEAEGVIANARPGAYVIDLSSTTPVFSKELAAMATVNDLHPVEAPLVVRDWTNHLAFADPDNLIALAAGEEADVEAVLPALEAIASCVQYCGQSSQGQVAKCAITMQQCAQLASLMEADALCRANVSGDMSASVAALAARERLTAPGVQKLADALLRRDFGEESTYNIELLWGELESALAAADDADIIVPQAEAALYLLELLAAIGGASMAPCALQLVYCDDDTVRRYGLDWNRAEQAFRATGFSEDGEFFEEYDDYDFEEDHDHGFNMGFDDFDDWSSN